MDVCAVDVARCMERYVGVFEGGGIKGIALAGAAAGALDLGINFERVIGTSAGALVGSLVSAGFDASELASFVERIDWSSLLDRSGLARIPGIGPHLAMLTSGGISQGSELERTWARMLRGRGVVTFGDLSDIPLQVVATDIAHGRAVVLPQAVEELGLEPSRFPVARAVRASAGVPFLLTPVKLAAQDDRWILVDGAFAARYPVQLVERDHPTIGFRLVPPAGVHEHHRIRGPISLAAAVISAGMTARETLPVLCRDANIVVEITSDHASLDFDLAPNTARSMFEAGYEQAQTQLAHLPSRLDG